MAFRSHPVTYGSCDSYFVEAEDYDWYQRRAQERERNRLRAKERQILLGQQLSTVTANEYSQDLLEHMNDMEVCCGPTRLTQPRTLPDVNSIDIQTEIQWFMRPYLLDFLVEIHSVFTLLPETLFLTINLLDRYCSKRVVYKRHYQLVGCAALLIAAKYGDKKDRVPRIKELKAMCCDLYEEEMFSQMEWHLLQTLDWTVGHPTVDAYLQIALSDTQYDTELEHMSWYVSELAIFHKEFVSVPPSMLSRASLALARFVLNKPSPCPESWADNYDAPLVARLYASLREPSPVVAKKYTAFEYSAVAGIAHAFVERQRQLESQRIMVPTPVVEIEVYPEARMEITPDHPQTPQKMPIPAIMSNGLYTPPITPENENGHGIYKHTIPIPQAPPTPTPSAPHQHMMYQQSHMMGQHASHYWRS